MSSAASAIANMPAVNPGIYCADDFRAIARMAHAEAGIILPDGKATLVYARLATLVRNSRCGTFAAYVQLIDRDLDERRRAIGALTTNHTFFYREAHHFEHFAKHVRPGLIREIEAGQTVRLWSAGCSSGEETWSLALTLLGEDRGAGRKLAGCDVRVLATDIADHALRKADAACYDAAALAQLPRKLHQNWVTEADGNATITEEARRIVRFRRLNLQGDWPMSKRFAAIFCRNVMIYFDQAAKVRLIELFAENLVPGGHLYIGHSEQTTGAAAKLFEPIGTTIFRRKL